MNDSGACNTPSDSVLQSEKINIRQYPSARGRVKEMNEVSQTITDVQNEATSMEFVEDFSREDNLTLERPIHESLSQRRKRQEEEFQKANKKHTAKISRASLPQTPLISITNRFKSFTETETMSVQHSTTTLADNQGSTSTLQVASSAPIMTPGTVPSKQKKPKPIILITKIQYFRLREVFKQLVSEMPVCQYCPKGLKIQASTDDDAQKIMSYLKDQHMEFYTFVSGQQKTIKVVMRGLPVDTPTEDIERQLLEMKYPIESVRQLRRKVENDDTGAKEWKMIPLWVITVYDIHNAPEIRKLTGLYNLKVSFSEYISQGGPQQCYHCQGFGHKAAGCFVSAKCVKCGQNHSSKECQKKPTEPPTCANCKQSHPANYRKCEKFLAYANGRNRYSHIESRQYSANVNDRDFPPLPKSTYSNQVRQPWHPISQTNDESCSIFSELKEMIQFVKHMFLNLRSIFNDIKKESDPITRLLMLGDGLCNAFQYD